MTRSYTRYHNHYHHSHAIHISGQWINIDYARITYRCAECLGKLRKRDCGLVCDSDDNHRGFIHRDEAAAIAAEQTKQLTDVETVYEIVDGQIITKEK